jgi:two-component system chemotaxis response regulator CheY
VRKTALIVDDSVTIRQLVIHTLNEAGFETLEGSNGQEGLARLDGASVQLIITDINMPVMDGLTFVKRVRENPTHKFTPILVLTTEGGSAKKSAGREAGATGWLVKPFQPDGLLQVVKKVVG